MQKKKTRDGIILAYRAVIEQRYQHENINAQYEIPDSFDKERVDLLRQFFLENIYPLPQKRDELDEAFQQLDGYIKNPEKLLRILMDSMSLIFKYGRHLPKILMAGIKALRSFRTASNFENKLVQNAQKQKIKAPYSKQQVYDLIAMLPEKEVDAFIENSQTLFETLHDRKLVQKIKEIVAHLITKMKKRPKVYTAEEVRGLEIGQEIIVKGDELFDSLSEEDQKLIFKVIIQIERDFLGGLFANNT